MTGWEIAAAIVTWGIFLYSVVLLCFYITIGFIAIPELKKYLNSHRFTDYRLIAASPYAPSISILAPAYNEGATITENVRSLLSIFYSNLEVIIINDGSKDDSLKKLIDAYDLEKIDFVVNYQVPAKEVRGVYKSRNPVYAKLLVVDKVNGGKADALNVGVNIASNSYIVCIDVDCVLEQDALLKMVKPFVDETNKRVIASGGVVRIANSCVIENGKLVEVRLPKQYLPRMQALEYIRAFLLGRMAWSRLNGLLIISGAFGAFDRDIVIKCGGYNHDTVGEDMELVVRMRRYMEENHLAYSVAYIPDPLCWTEAPSSYQILRRQRNRWTRGTIETMWIHKKLFLNPRYGILGMLSFPYWFFYEMLAPLVEFFGFLAFLVMALLGMISWKLFFALLGFIILFGYVFSAIAIYMEVSTYNQYRRRREVFMLILTAISEPFLFHPVVVVSAVQGYVDLLRKKKSWGEMTRQGFGATAATQTPATPKAVSQPETQRKKSFENAVVKYTGHLLMFTVFILLLRTFELFSESYLRGLPIGADQIIRIAIVNDLCFAASTATILLLPYLLCYYLKPSFGSVFIKMTLLLFAIVHAALIQYFITTLVPLGADFWSYSWADIKQTVGAAGISLTTIVGMILLLVVAAYLIIAVPGKIFAGLFFSCGWLLTCITTFYFVVENKRPFIEGNEHSKTLVLNKSLAFYRASVLRFLPEESERGTRSSGSAYDYVDDSEYVFLRKDETRDVLSPFFKAGIYKPNIVFIIVEGLGRAFTNEGAYFGNFTPFLDSLSAHSLYWPNALSTQGRTFGVLPSVLASAPFARNGFAELNERIPPHFSIVSLLKPAGYKTSFYYGGNSSFDFMRSFLNKTGIDEIKDINSFPGGYEQMPSTNNFSWGYGDKELFNFYQRTSLPSQQAYCNVLLTVSTHNPFLINEQDAYFQKLDKYIATAKLPQEHKNGYKNYRFQLASVLYTDDALRQFFATYRTRQDFDRTIFIITGDHRMPEIPMRDKLDRYHVPLVIYSPLLVRTGNFKSIVSHFDITPSLLTFLESKQQVVMPELVTWMGQGLDTSATFKGTGAYPLMQTKNDLVDYINGTGLINQGTYYKINEDMSVEEDVMNEKKQATIQLFSDFRNRNKLFIQKGTLLPDSLYRKYLK